MSCPTWYFACLAVSSLVEDELALAGDLQPIERAVVLDADLVLALEQRVRGQGPHRQRHPIETSRIVFGTADAIAEVIGIVRVHLVRSLSVPGIWLGVAKMPIHFLTRIIMFTSQCNTGLNESTFKTPDRMKNASERHASQH
jgi:hypothetical protein